MYHFIGLPKMIFGLTVLQQSVPYQLSSATFQHTVAVAGHFGISAEMSRPKDRNVQAYGPNCLGTRTEMSQCRNVLVPKCLNTSAPVPKCLWSELSWVRCVRKPILGPVWPTVPSNFMLAYAQFAGVEN